MSKKNRVDDAMHIQEDLALAKTFHEHYEKLAPKYGYETRKDTREFDADSDNGRLMLAVAGEIRRQIIDPTIISASIKMLEADRNGLYQSMPVGDIDAWGLLELIQNHLSKLDQTINSLKASLTGSTAPEAEVVKDEDKKA